MKKIVLLALLNVASLRAIDEVGLVIMAGGSGGDVQLPISDYVNPTGDTYDYIKKKLQKVYEKRKSLPVKITCGYNGAIEMITLHDKTKFAEGARTIVATVQALMKRSESNP